MKRIRNLVGLDGGLLVGVDMKKDEEILNHAYNDEQGVTAEFNLNMLMHINREYGADFDLDSFAHEAMYNEKEGCVQMFLVSRIPQQVNLGDQSFDFAAGERIHTENSHKYTVQEVHQIAKEAGFASVKTWQDSAGLFGVFYLYNQ